MIKVLVQKTSLLVEGDFIVQYARACHPLKTEQGTITDQFDPAAHKNSTILGQFGGIMWISNTQNLRP